MFGSRDLDYEHLNLPAVNTRKQFSQLAQSYDYDSTQHKVNMFNNSKLFDKTNEFSHMKSSRHDLQADDSIDVLSPTYSIRTLEKTKLPSK